MTLAVKRKSTPQTRAGQYMCPECGQIFETKKEVDSHLHMMHEPHLSTVHGKLQHYTNFTEFAILP